ncbi:MAG: RNA polymerase sigma factor region1.1 domain-containing protein, partial [Chlamydiota bacterium]|nr:RNA polymerase sigma factor region1.1 domain-containing protein [Chlamydiota bacterium]
MKKAERTSKIKELVQLAQANGMLTFNDINRVLPQKVVSPDEIESFLILLKSMDVRIEDEAKDKARALQEKKQAKKEEDAAKSEILDDPVRMYLKQMGQVPLLNREQEVKLAKKIEEAAMQIRNILYRFGNVAKESVFVMRKLLAGKERFDRVVQDK